MYSHGLALSAERQYQEGLLNGALFVMEKRSHDDPFSALARLVKGRSPSRLRDLVTLARSPVQLAHCVGIKLLENDRMPHRMRELIVETVIRRMPNRAAREYQFRGLPHKLDGALLQGICEQAPEPSNRVTLASTRDPFGQPRARINWRPGDAARRTLMRMGELAQDAFPQAGLPPPVPYDWIAERHLERAVVTDSGHTMGTTRMSDSPSTGVVDTDCRLHEVTGLYVAGGSVMPTSGHANPTLMMVALAIRLADHLRAQLRSA
jgi:choline dehydrogenase-like flavoprotein